MDRVSFCNIYVIQQDTQYLMINFIRNIQQLDMFRTSVVHLQERSYAVCCNLVCLDTSCWYEGEGRTASSSSFTFTMWKNKVQLGTSQMKIYYGAEKMRFSFLMTKERIQRPLVMCNIYCLSTPTLVTLTRHSVTL